MGTSQNLKSFSDARSDEDLEMIKSLKIDAVTRLSFGMPVSAISMSDAKRIEEILKSLIEDIESGLGFSPRTQGKLVGYVQALLVFDNKVSACVQLEKVMVKRYVKTKGFDNTLVFASEHKAIALENLYENS